MTAHEQISAMLDQLMGTARNGTDTKPDIGFEDPSVCKSFLVSSCPYEILASTRLDIGNCNKIHSLALRADYEAAAKVKDYFYDLEALEYLRIFVDDADRKTDQAKKRLLDTQQEYSGDAREMEEKLHDLGEKIGIALAKAEALGADGKVEESLKVLTEIDDLKKKKTAAYLAFRNSIPSAAFQQQKLRVCEVCSAYLGMNDNDRRLTDHFGGKLHLGFIRIRETLKEFSAKAEERRRQKRESYHRADLDREYDRDRRHERSRHHRRPKERQRSPTRECRRTTSRSGSYSREYDHYSKRSRSKSPVYYARSRQTRRHTEDESD